LAAGFLKSAAFHAGLETDFAIEILDARQAATGGCAHIIREIIRRAPDVVGTSIYLWNAQRNSYILAEVKKHLDGLRVVAGGPEVTRDADYILQDRAYDFFVFGEGERTWVELLRQMRSRRPVFTDVRGMAFRDGEELFVHPLHQPIVDVNEVPSPYLEGILDPADCGEILLFTMRGCLQGCSYCSWSARGRLRAFAADRLHEELLVARKAADRLGRRVIVSVADSAFNTSPAFWDFCGSAKQINRDGSLDIRCFLQAELIDDAVARALKEAGVCTAEIGLQSTDPDVLANINRRDDIDRFLEGVQVLKDWGFPIVVDSILGLPGDTRESFEQTLRFNRQHNLSPLVFNLSLGHGSKLRGKAAEFGLRPDEHPPFYVYETEHLAHAQITEIMRENVGILADSDPLDDLQFPLAGAWAAQMPPGNGQDDEQGRPASAPITHISVCAGTGDDQHRERVLHESILRNIAGHVTLSVELTEETDAPDLAWLETLLARAVERNPFSTWTLLFEGGNARLRQAAVEFALDRKPTLRSFLGHRDLLYPDDIPRVRNRPFAVYSIEPVSAVTRLPSAHYLSYLRVQALDDSESLRAAADAAGAGLVVDTPAPLNREDKVRSFLDRLVALHESGKALFFKDWVLQRYWQQNYVKSSPRMIARHEVMVRGDGVRHLELGEADLYLDAIVRCGLSVTGQHGAEMEEMIVDAAVQHIRAISEGI
jgi:hypothetical protein